MKKTTPATTPLLRRRDTAGNLDPAYVASLLSHSQGSADQDDKAFLKGARSQDDLAEHLGESFVASATSGENDEEEALDTIVPEETGGPFVVTTSDVEIAQGTDASNPRRATREPFPRT